MFVETNVPKRRVNIGHYNSRLMLMLFAEYVNAQVLSRIDNVAFKAAPAALIDVKM